jgi:hypothetical protein
MRLVLSKPNNFLKGRQFSPRLLVFFNLIYLVVLQGFQNLVGLLKHPLYLQGFGNLAGKLKTINYENSKPYHL